MSTRPAPPARIQVLIAGGGPVGLAAAMELNLHGVSCAVIEPRPDVNWLRPRAKTVSARTMEHLRRWGLAEELRKKAPLKVAWSSDIVFCTTLTGREITRFHDAFGLGLTGSDMVGDSVYDHLGTGFTLIRCDNLTGKHDDDGGLIAAAEEFGVPLTVLDLDGPDWARHFGAALVLVRPDQHVSWSGPPPADPRALIRTAVGWAG